MPRINESVIKFELLERDSPVRTVRIWVQEDHAFSDYYGQSIRRHLLLRWQESGSVPLAVEDTIRRCPRLSAIEILDPGGSGYLIYPEWP